MEKSVFFLNDNEVGLILGWCSVASAFTSVVTSFVSDILLPPLSLLPFINRNMDEKFAVLRAGKNYHNGTHGHGYNTLSQALDDGAVVMAYGSVQSGTLGRQHKR
jgi:large conductance mechanosensitive channel